MTQVTYAVNSMSVRIDSGPMCAILLDSGDVRRDNARARTTPRGLRRYFGVLSSHSSDRHLMVPKRAEPGRFAAEPAVGAHSRSGSMAQVGCSPGRVHHPGRCSHRSASSGCRSGECRPARTRHTQSQRRFTKSRMVLGSTRQTYTPARSHANRPLTCRSADRGRTGTAGRSPGRRLSWSPVRWCAASCG